MCYFYLQLIAELDLPFSIYSSTQFQLFCHITLSFTTTSLLRYWGPFASCVYSGAWKTFATLWRLSVHPSFPSSAPSSSSTSSPQYVRPDNLWSHRDFVALQYFTTPPKLPRNIFCTSDCWLCTHVFGRRHHGGQLLRGHSPWRLRIIRPCLRYCLLHDGWNLLGWFIPFPYMSWFSVQLGWKR
jgi:hypothetical protein